MTSARPGSLTVGRRVTGKKISPWVFGRAYTLAASNGPSGGIRHPATSSKNLIDRAVWSKKRSFLQKPKKVKICWMWCQRLPGTRRALLNGRLGQATAREGFCSPAQKTLFFSTSPRVFALAPRERRVRERQVGWRDLSLMPWAVFPPSFVELGAREGTALMRAGL